MKLCKGNAGLVKRKCMTVDKCHQTCCHVTRYSMVCLVIVAPYQGRPSVASWRPMLPSITVTHLFFLVDILKSVQLPFTRFFSDDWTTLVNELGISANHS